MVHSGLFHDSLQLTKKPLVKVGKGGTSMRDREALIRILIDLFQLKFTCSKSKTEKLEQGVKFVQS